MHPMRAAMDFAKTVVENNPSITGTELNRLVVAKFRRPLNDANGFAVATRKKVGSL